MRGALVVAAWSALLVSGCAGRRPPPVDAQVKRVSFEGNGPWLSARSDLALINAMAHPTPRGVWPFKKTVSLDRERLEAERKRLAVYYAHQGYFDARITAWEVVELKPGTGSRPPTVAIVGTVEEGAPSEVASVGVEGLDALSGPLARQAKRSVMLSEGQVFSKAEHEASLEEVRRLLQDHARAHATVDGRVEVDREAREVDLTYTVKPGPVSRFGEVSIEGADRVPIEAVRDHLEIEPGEGFARSLIERSRQQLYGLGVFSVVRVQPQLEDGSEIVPVEVELERSPPRTVSAAAGLHIESGRQEALARVGASHDNALHRLVGLSAEVEGGYATLSDSVADVVDPASLLAVRSGPVFDATGELTVPRVPVPGWELGVSVELERELTEAFVTTSPSVTPSISGPLTPWLSLTAAYRLRFTRYSDVQLDTQSLSAVSSAPDLVEGRYFLTELEQTLLVDTRDAPLSPTRGMRHSLTLEEAGRWLGGNYDYLGAHLDLRGYLSPRRLVGPGWVFAGRVGGGILQPYGSQADRGIPVAERLYLGGSGSVRGWIYQHLGPQGCSVDVEDGCDDVPIGGRASALGSLEVRRSWNPWGAVAFVDAGMVWESLDRVERVPVLPSVGLGGRYHSPVGPIRLDVAVRTDAMERFADEPRLWLHLGLGEAF